MKLKSITKLNKKGQVGGLSSNIVALGVAAIVLVLMVVILQELRDTDVVHGPNVDGCNATTTANCDEAFKAANETLVGVGTFGDFWTIIVLAIVAAVVIGIVFASFGGLTTNR